MKIGFIIALGFAIIVAILGVQNPTVIPVNFFSTNINISLALIIFISSIIGAIIVTLFSLKKEFTLTLGNKRLTKKAKNFQNEIEISKNENVILKSENEILKNKTEALETENKALSSEVNELNIENKRLNVI